MMGFPLDQAHPHYLSPEQFQAITQWVQGVALVGELSTNDPTVIEQTLGQYALDYLQLDDPVASTRLGHLGVPMLIRLRLQGHETLTSLQSRMEAYGPEVQYFLLEAADAQEKTVAALQPKINSLAQHFPILQGCYITPDALPDLLGTSLKGIALQGGTETKPGYKGFDELAAVLEELAVE